MHDRAVAAMAVALQRADITFEAGALRDDGSNPRAVVGIQCDVHDPGIGQRMSLVAGTDYDGRHLALFKNPGTGDGGDVDAVVVADCLQRLKQLLEQVPAAEIVDDQLVFDQ